MGSDFAVLCQDLNLRPGLLPLSLSALLVPKTEPKLEPFDEPLPQPAATPEVLSDYNHLSELFLSTFGKDCQEFEYVPSIPDSDPNSRAIVPVPNPEPQLSNIVLTPRASRKYPTRSSELVRVTDLKPGDRSYFRDVIRKARMLYDSLRVFEVSAAESRRFSTVPHRRSRADLKAAAVMRERGLWLNRNQRIVGDIPGVAIGDVFLFRMELCVVGLHGQSQAGIDYVPPSQSPNGEPIATSIIISGGYEDDEDTGDVIVYTGHGGQDKYGRQIMHQQLEYGNLALERSMTYGVEVRVIRGFKYGNSVNGKVYVYDGLYRVTETWFDIGKSGFGVFKFKLVRIQNQVEMGSTVLKSVANLNIQALVAQPKGYVTLDLSRKKEMFPVFFYNDVDGNCDPVNYDYLVRTVFPSHVYSCGGLFGCNCVGGCLNDCVCAMRNGGQFAYNQNGTLVRGKPLILECGPKCSCPPSCQNRVAQKGIVNRFEVFRSRETGWGVRSLDLIQAGSFICEYAGVVLTHEQAQIFTMNGDNLIYPHRFAERWKEWGNLSEICSGYSAPNFPSIAPVDFALDVSRMRNIGCYMSHSSSPNVMVQLVLYDHNNVSFPHLMLFAMENIPPMRELSLDYGVDDEWMRKPAICN